MISRRSCRGGRPKSRARPRRSKRQADSDGSIHSQRASDRSLGYARRSVMTSGCRPAGACTPACNLPRRSTEQARAETGASRHPPRLSHRQPHHTQPHPTRWAVGRVGDREGLGLGPTHQLLDQPVVHGCLRRHSLRRHGLRGLDSLWLGPFPPVIDVCSTTGSYADPAPNQGRVRWGSSSGPSQTSPIGSPTGTGSTAAKDRQLNGAMHTSPRPYEARPRHEGSCHRQDRRGKISRSPQRVSCALPPHPHDPRTA